MYEPEAQGSPCLQSQQLHASLPQTSSVTTSGTGACKGHIPHTCSYHNSTSVRRTAAAMPHTPAAPFWQLPACMATFLSAPHVPVTTICNWAPGLPCPRALSEAPAAQEESLPWKVRSRRRRAAPASSPSACPTKHSVAQGTQPALVRSCRWTHLVAPTNSTANTVALRLRPAPPAAAMQTRTRPPERPCLPCLFHQQVQAAASARAATPPCFASPAAALTTACPACVRTKAAAGHTRPSATCRIPHRGRRRYRVLHACHVPSHAVTGLPLLCVPDLDFPCSPRYPAARPLLPPRAVNGHAARHGTATWHVPRAATCTHHGCLTLMPLFSRTSCCQRPRCQAWHCHVARATCRHMYPSWVSDLDALVLQDVLRSTT